MFNGITFFDRNKVFLFVGVVCVICMLSYTNTSQAVDEIFSRKGNSYSKIMELSDKDRARYGTFNHPYSFSEKEMIEIFSHIYFQAKGIIGYGKTERVFSDADLVSVLAPLLVEGVMQLRPSQYLLVYNSLTRPYLKSKHNYFCIFVANHNLYIVFGRIHQELLYRHSDEENLIANMIDFESPMDIKKGPLWKLIPTKGQLIPPDRENVLVIPLVRHVVDSSVRKDAGKAVSIQPPRKNENNESIISTQAAEITTPLKAAENSLPAQTVDEQQSFKEKLKFLKSLREEGLISDENYETKKKELLDKYFKINE